MPLSMTPGSSIIASPELRCRHGLRRDLSSSALPILPAIRFTRGKYFGASRFTHLLRPAKLLAPLYGSDRHARPPGAFTSRLPTDRLPSPLLDMTTTATGLLCWRDSHPLEWQLASLHQTPDWLLPEEALRIERSFRFRNFREALTFVQEVGELAEAEGHHPNISFGWGNATVSLQTKKIKGLHENDFIMATKIDRIFVRTATA